MAETRMMSVGGNHFGAADPTDFTNFVVDSSTDGVAWISQAQEAATITHLGFRQGVLTGSSPVYIIGFETRGDDGHPDGTILGGGSPQSATFTPSGDGTWQWIELDNMRTVARGDVICVTVRYSSGTIDGSNNVSFTYRSAILGQGRVVFPYGVTLASGSWTSQDDSPVWGMKSSSRSYGAPIEGGAGHVFDAADSPDEFGVAFTFPDGFSDVVNVLGGQLALDNNLSTGDFIMSLYNDTTLLQEVSITGTLGTVSSRPDSHFLFDETILSDLSPGTEYILSFKTDDTSLTISVFTLLFDTSAELQGMAPFGLACLKCREASRTNSGAWSFDATVLPAISLIVQTVTEASSLTQRQSIHTNIGTY